MQLRPNRRRDCDRGCHGTTRTPPCGVAATILSSVTFFPVSRCPPYAADHGDATVGCRAGKAVRIARGARCRPSGHSRWTDGNVHDVGVPPRPRADEQGVRGLRRGPLRGGCRVYDNKKFPPVDALSPTGILGDARGSTRELGERMLADRAEYLAEMIQTMSLGE